MKVVVVVAVVFKIILFWPHLNDLGHFSRAKTMSFSKIPEFLKGTG